MKRVLFMWVTSWLAFDTIEELEEYKEINKDKGWKFRGEHEEEDYYILVVEKPYGEYNPGW